MSDQADSWGRAAQGYEQEFIDPDRPGARNPLRDAVAALAAPERTAADLGCGVGPLLPFLAERFGRVFAVDFAEGMLARENPPHLPGLFPWSAGFLFSPALTIGGGTAEVQRNIIAEQVLGLPRDPG